MKLSECHLKLASKHEAASALVDASNAFKKTNKRGAQRLPHAHEPHPRAQRALRAPRHHRPALHTCARAHALTHTRCPESAQCLNKAAEYFTDLGRLSIAAKHFKDMAEIFEEQAEITDAIVYYSKAADLYSGEEVTSTANNCKLKVAQLSAQIEDYSAAIQLFNEVALSSLDSNLLKYSVKGYLLNGGLCVLCSGDSVAIDNAISKAVEMDATFEDTREHKLLGDLAAAMEAGDVPTFTSVVQEFDSMSRLDQWKTTLLLRAKKRCAARETAGGDDDDLT